MREFIVWFALCLCILTGFCVAVAYADEPRKDCTFKPSQSDEVIKHCGTLHGVGSVSLRLCGINYVIDMDCK